MFWYKKGNMKVTKQNYESYLIDFMDGNLNPSLKEDLFAFLEEHPEIKAEFENFEIINTSVNEDISFDLKDRLRKPQITSTENIHENNYAEYFIASVEEYLTNIQKAELEQFIIQNPNLLNTYNLYKQTKAQPDLSISYPNKKLLKKYPFYQRKAWYYIASAVASVILLLSILYSNRNKDVTQEQYAQEERIDVPMRMEFLMENITIAIPIERISLDYRNFSMPTIENHQDFIITEERIQMLKSRLNTKKYLASLQPDFQAPGFIPQMNFETYSASVHGTIQTNYAQIQKDGKNKKVVKAIWGGLFGQFKKNNQQEAGSSDGQNRKQIGPIWALANIGLERINEVTGTKMRINSKSTD
jgi:hypothetical protein